MKKRKMMRRGVSMLLAALLCMSCLGGPVVFAADPEPFTPAASSAPQEPDETKEEPGTPAEGDAGESGPSGTPEEGNDSQQGEPETPVGDEPDAAALSEAAQAFVAAVNDLDREKILSASNAWGLAHKAWLENQEDADLTAALDTAAAASDEAAASLYGAEDLYYTIPEDEQGNEAIQTAYLALMSLIVAMHEKMDHPVLPAAPTDPDEPANPGTNDGDETPTEPDRDEITSILYSDLPDAPTDYYMGRYGLPVATGETKISISQWHDGQMAAAGYIHDSKRKIRWVRGHLPVAPSLAAYQRGHSPCSNFCRLVIFRQPASGRSGIPARVWPRHAGDCFRPCSRRTHRI